MMDNERTKLLAESIDLMNGQRATDYGDAREMFTTVANMWSAYLGHAVSPADVCHMMALLKIARLRNGKHRDSSADGAAYLALGFEVDT